MRNPPALPGDPKSLTYAGIWYMNYIPTRKPGDPKSLTYAGIILAYAPQQAAMLMRYFPWLPMAIYSAKLSG